MIKFFGNQEKKQKRKIVTLTDEGNTQNALSAIYKDEEDGEYDMSRFEKGTRYHAVKIGAMILLGLIFFTAAAGGVYFFAFKNKISQPGQKGVSIDLDAPTSVASGDTVTFELTLENKDAVGLKQGALQLKYPEGFKFEKSQPSAKTDKGNEWDISPLAPGGAVKITVTGQILGEVHTTKEFLAAWTYQPENFSSNFEVTKSWVVSIDSSILEINVEMPKKTLPKQEFSLKLSYKNTSQIDLEEIRLQIAYPDAFSFVEADPKPKEKNSVWFVKDLAKGEEGNITAKGNIDAEIGKELEFTTELAVKDSEGLFREQVQKKNLLLVINPNIDLQFSVNDASDEHSFQLGDTLQYKANYDNTSDLALENVTLTLEMKGATELLDLEALIFDGKAQPFIEGNKITFTGTQMEGLHLVAPKEKGEVRWAVPVKKSPEGAVKPHNASVENVLKFTFKAKDDEIQSDTLPKPEKSVINRLQTSASLFSEARYYRDNREKLGSGPIPPEVNRSTTYRVFWNIENTHNDLTGAQVSTTLPSDVLWEQDAKADKGSITYNIESRKVVWNLDKVSSYISQDENPAQAYFDVTINPTQDDLGKVVIITNESSFTAQDAFTKNNITAQNPPLNSDIPTDPIGKGQGEVVPAMNTGDGSQEGNTNTNKNNNGNKNANSNK